MSTRVLTARLAGHYIYVYGQPRGLAGVVTSYLTIRAMMTMAVIGAACWLLASTQLSWATVQDVVFFLRNI